jgi:hypothetical protein
MTSFENMPHAVSELCFSSLRRMPHIDYAVTEAIEFSCGFLANVNNFRWSHILFYEPQCFPKLGDFASGGIAHCKNIIGLMRVKVQFYPARFLIDMEWIKLLYSH